MPCQNVTLCDIKKVCYCHSFGDKYHFACDSAGKPRLKIGGALRFNYNYSDWKPESRNRGGEFDFDVLRLNVNASYKKSI